LRKLAGCNKEGAFSQMPKKTQRQPCSVPSQRKCLECGREIRKRDIESGNAKQAADNEFICVLCLPSDTSKATVIKKSRHRQYMLRELANARQIKGEYPRRWFTNGPVDLIVWLDGHRIHGFQLITSTNCEQTAITWYRDRGISVAGIDDGEGRPGRAKMTPILTRPGKIDPAEVLELFAAISEELPLGLADFVESRISEHLHAAIRGAAD
jgi:hypothetical protein